MANNLDHSAQITSLLAQDSDFDDICNGRCALFKSLLEFGCTTNDDVMYLSGQTRAYWLKDDKGVLLQSSVADEVLGNTMAKPKAMDLLDKLPIKDLADGLNLPFEAFNVVGGCMSHWNGYTHSHGDIDIFVYVDDCTMDSLKHEEYDKMLASFFKEERTTPYKYEKLCSDGRSICSFAGAIAGNIINIIFIHFKYMQNTPIQNLYYILKYFDLAPCRVGYNWDADILLDLTPIHFCKPADAPYTKDRVLKYLSRRVVLPSEAEASASDASETSDASEE